MSELDLTAIKAGLEAHDRMGGSAADWERRAEFQRLATEHVRCLVAEVEQLRATVASVEAIERRWHGSYSMMHGELRAALEGADR